MDTFKWQILCDIYFTTIKNTAWYPQRVPESTWGGTKPSAVGERVWGGFSETIASELRRISRRRQKSRGEEGRAQRFSGVSMQTPPGRGPAAPGGLPCPAKGPGLHPKENPEGDDQAGGSTSNTLEGLASFQGPCVKSGTDPAKSYLGGKRGEAACCLRGRQAALVHSTAASTGVLSPQRVCQVHKARLAVGKQEPQKQRARE